jgi:hypothetical protein
MAAAAILDFLNLHFRIPPFLDYPLDEVYICKIS